ncbi:hypothetical protein HAP48_0042890 [Bradyrhizobium septentrionale]|uniref:Uncharacterized protein n=1 Tax=Bradyrhizobium septentrionale TaxID=1404411 RepID=A0A974A2S7_9BRAD|nr:hypothetical protein [Bradyrhizobium septentrionale]UGY15205.1 hypothetical protein HAP48_0042890 [Bradyrhizobium septentrionale]
MPSHDNDNVTPVIFRACTFKEPEGRAAEITAVFPAELGAYDANTMSCYAHLGQHGICDVGWYIRTRPATPEEYADLKRELEAAPFGYRFKVYDRMQPWMRTARLAQERSLRGRGA